MVTHMLSVKQMLADAKILDGSFPATFAGTADSAPYPTFERWITDAFYHPVKEFQVCTLSTVDSSGNPDARVVALRDFDQRGWYFAASAESPKGLQIAENPHACLTFYWTELARQIRILGEVRSCPVDEGVADFLARPLEAQASILSRRQSSVMKGWGEYDEIQRRYKQDQPSTADIQALIPWRKFRLEADRVEFWQCTANRRFARVSYVKISSDNWLREELWP
jgi:pyridoxamine 5'-phosphate oxidase